MNLSDYPTAWQRKTLWSAVTAFAMVLIGSSASFGINPDLIAFHKDVNAMHSLDYEFAVAFQKSTLFRDIPQAYFDTLVSENMKAPLSVWKKALNGFLFDDNTKDLHKIQAPTLIMWGDKDALAKEQDQKVLSTIKRSRLKKFTDVGHSIQWEIPEEFTKELVFFIQELNGD